MKEVVLVTLCLLFLGCSHSTSPWDMPERDLTKTVRAYFPNDREAIDRGTALAFFMAKGSYMRPIDQRDGFLGRQIVCTGIVAPPGDGPDLLIAAHPPVALKVTWPEAMDVRPPASTWVACVRGTVQHVDWQRRVVTIDAEPSDWKALLAR